MDLNFLISYLILFPLFTLFSFIILYHLLSVYMFDKHVKKRYITEYLLFENKIKEGKVNIPENYNNTFDFIYDEMSKVFSKLNHYYKDKELFKKDINKYRGSKK